MSRFRFTALTFSLVLGATSAAWAQTDTTSEDDFSQYANVGFADAGSKRFGAQVAVARPCSCRRNVLAFRIWRIVVGAAIILLYLLGIELTIV